MHKDSKRPASHGLKTPLEHQTHEQMHPGCNAGSGCSKPSTWGKEGSAFHVGKAPKESTDVGGGKSVNLVTGYVEGKH